MIGFIEVAVANIFIVLSLTVVKNANLGVVGILGILGFGNLFNAVITFAFSARDSSSRKAFKFSSTEVLFAVVWVVSYSLSYFPLALSPVSFSMSQIGFLHIAGPILGGVIAGRIAKERFRVTLIGVISSAGMVATGIILLSQPGQSWGKTTPALFGAMIMGIVATTVLTYFISKRCDWQRVLVLIGVGIAIVMFAAPWVFGFGQVDYNTVLIKGSIVGALLFCTRFLTFNGQAKVSAISGSVAKSILVPCGVLVDYFLRGGVPTAFALNAILFTAFAMLFHVRKFGQDSNWLSRKQA